jgi:hypothetical protein
LILAVVTLAIYMVGIASFMHQRDAFNGVVRDYCQKEKAVIELDKIVPANPTPENLAALEAAMKAKTDAYARVVGRLEAPCEP